MPEPPTRDLPPPGHPTADQSAAGLTGELTAAATNTPDFGTNPPPGGRPVVPGYELAEEVGRGGMGVVYRAKDVAFGRDVAVKLLQDKFPADGVAARRFADEARITGQLQHPGIPAAYQTGVLHDGRPFLTMKLIKGQTLDDLLKAGGSANLIAAFEKVCEAVGYAHAHGVIHRDLKPQNVMVGSHGEVQVMDWGLAKVLAGRDGQRPEDDPDATALLNPQSEIRIPQSDQTQAGSLLGTPAYMPPEQAIGAVGLVDARSDVFGLGAILCAILTGKPPYVGETAESTRQLAAWAKLDDAQTRLDGCRADPGLVALCKRCLSPEKDDRPADAGAVAAEVATLRAAADDRAKQAEVDRVRAEAEAREQRKRRRVQLVLGSAVLTAVVAGGGAAGWQWWRAEGALAGVTAEQGRTAAQLAKTEAAEGVARVEAEKARVEEGKALDAADLAGWKEREAAEAAADAEAFGRFLEEKFLAATRPAGVQLGQGVDVKVSDALAKAEADIPAVFKGRPAAEARARHAVGVTWRNLAQYARAERNLTRAVELRDRALGPDHPETLNSLNSLAVVVDHRGEYKRAVTLYARVLPAREKALGPDHRDTLMTAGNLASLYSWMGAHDKAKPLLERTLERSERALGPDDPDTLRAAGRLAAMYRDVGDLRRAEPLSERALAGYERVLGPDHPDTLTALSHYAHLKFLQRDYAAAERLYRRSLAGRERVLGPDHPETLQGVHGVAAACAERGETTVAERLYRRALEGQAKALGPDHRNTLETATSLAILYWQTGQLDRAIPLFEDTTRRWEDALGSDHPTTIQTLGSLGQAYKDAGRAAEAVPLLERAYAARGRHPTLPDYADQLTDAYAKAGRPADAAGVLREQLAEKRRRLKPGSPELCAALAGTAYWLIDFDPAAAEALLRECLPLSETLAPRAWSTANDKSVLGDALLRQGKPAEAEPLLVAGYAGLLADRTSIPPPAKANLPDAASRLARVYLALGKPDEAAKWRAERAKYPPDTAPPPRPVVSPTPPTPSASP